MSAASPGSPPADPREAARDAELVATAVRAITDEYFGGDEPRTSIAWHQRAAMLRTRLAAALRAPVAEPPREATDALLEEAATAMRGAATEYETPRGFTKAGLRLLWLAGELEGMVGRAAAPASPVPSEATDAVCRKLLDAIASEYHEALTAGCDNYGAWQCAMKAGERFIAALRAASGRPPTTEATK